MRSVKDWHLCRVGQRLQVPSFSIKERMLTVSYCVGLRILFGQNGEMMIAGTRVPGPFGIDGGRRHVVQKPPFSS